MGLKSQPFRMPCLISLGWHRSVVYWNEAFMKHLGDKYCFLRWPRELNALQLQKTHANRKSISKSRKHLHQFDSRCCKCSKARVLSNWWSCFLNLQAFFFLFAACWALLATVVFFYFLFLSWQGNRKDWLKNRQAVLLMKAYLVYRLELYWFKWYKLHDVIL